MLNPTGTLKTLNTWIKVEGGVLLFLIKTIGGLNNFDFLFFKLNLSSRHVPEVRDQINGFNTSLVKYFD
jgi:hypothetical protein